MSHNFQFRVFKHYFENTSRIFFNFWVTMFNDIVVNILKSTRPTDRATQIFFSLSSMAFFLFFSLSYTNPHWWSSSSFLFFVWFLFWSLLFCWFTSSKSNKTHLNFVKTYVFHLLGTYINILCNWLIFWQNALYL